MAGGHKTGFNRERRDRREHVSAIGTGIHDLAVIHHLGEQVIDVGIPATGAIDDGDLAGERVAAADAVNLQWMPGPHHRQQDAVAQRRFRGQIRCEEERPLRGAAAHEHARQAEQVIRIDGRIHAKITLIQEHDSILAWARPI